MYLQSDMNLLAYVDAKSRKFIGASYGLLQQCGGLSEMVLCELVLKKFLQIFVIHFGLC